MSTSTDPPKRYRIGYALPAKKIDTLITPSLVTYFNNHNIDILPINPSKPLSEQGPFDCIVHKLYASDWISQLHRFSSHNPHVPIIDTPASIERLHSRVSMLGLVTRLQLSSRREIVTVPKQIVVSDKDGLNKIELGKLGLGFPLIAKPIVADGSVMSHKMFLVFDYEGIGSLETPIVLQEFVNHGGVMFKVYVAGSYVKCVKRKSLPDITDNQSRTLKGSVSFSQVSNLAAEDGEIYFDEVEIPPEDFMDEVAMGMKEEMGLNLFNFDVIRDGKDADRYLVIDINYFPGYAKMPDYEAVLTKFLLDVMEKRKGGGLVNKASNE